MAPKTEKTEETAAKSGDPLDLSTPDAGAPDQTSAAAAAEGSDPVETVSKPADPDLAKTPAKAKTVKPSGVLAVFLLKDGPLGEKGRVVRVSKRKLSDLKLKKGADWAEPSDDQLRIGG